MPDAFIGVDIIIGMRGETDGLFAESYATAESLDISQLHVFSYSERPGTKALGIDLIVPPEVKSARCDMMLKLSEAKRLAFYSSQRGKTRKVLFEKPAKGAPMHGFTDNYVRVELPYDKTLVNCTAMVELGDFNETGTALTAKNVFV